MSMRDTRRVEELQGGDAGDRLSLLERSFAITLTPRQYQGSFSSTENSGRPTPRVGYLHPGRVGSLDIQIKVSKKTQPGRYVLRRRISEKRSYRRYGAKTPLRVRLYEPVTRKKPTTLEYKKPFFPDTTFVCMFVCLFKCLNFGHQLGTSTAGG